MTALLHIEFPMEIPSQSKSRSIFDWVKARLDARRRRQLEREEARRLRFLEPYLLTDAGINTAVLFSASARITAAHLYF